MQFTDYQLSEPQAPTLGLIVLRADETLEGEIRRFFPPDLARIHVTRVHSGDDLTPESIAEMATHIEMATALLPASARFDVIAYACTSGTAQIGAKRVAGLISRTATTRAVTNPLSAAIRAMEHLRIRRIGLVSPYLDTVSAPVCAAFEGKGISVAKTLSFGECIEARVARIHPHSIREATQALAAGGGIDGLFLSCTNLRTIDILDDLSNELGLPVLSSNQVLAWDMAEQAGLPTNALTHPSLGTLLETVTGS